MLRVAIVGCGKIADDHLSQIRRIRGCEVVGVADLEPLMARQLAERFEIPKYFADFEQMLADLRPDVVHITTPPDSHFGIATKCLEAGSHVYVEKPFALFEQDAQSLIDLANRRGLKITAGHDDQFRNVARRMRGLVASGFLGSGPVHMESTYCYELGASSYAGALLGNKRHWVRRLPGKLLHNIISHGIARIAEFLNGDSPQVIASGFVSPFLESQGERELVDELRVLICDENKRTAYFTFSSQMRPALHEFRIYGSKNGLVLDQDHETLIKLPGRRLPSYAEKFISPLSLGRQYVSNVRVNVQSFLHNDFHMKAGMKYLIEAFYRSIVEGAPDPIPHREILLTAKIMDSIFSQINFQNQSVASPSQLETHVGSLNR